VALRRSAIWRGFQCSAPHSWQLHISHKMLSSTFCDEVGYLSCDDKAADLLYEVVNRRYERKSLIVTTNRPFQQWNEVFPNATCIATLLDRLLHHADATVVEGDSYRYREAEIENNARQRRHSKS
ncbi:MAG: ATP-binding protein, partial [Bryobacterales bacterium]|nr:ATP-binding protein [Bryobacterales bacterium]